MTVSPKPISASRYALFHFFLALAVLFCPTFAAAQSPPQGRELFGAGWKLIPSIIVLGAADDPRLPLVRDAVSHWNGIFRELGTPFRLGAVTRRDDEFDANEVARLSETVVGRGGPPPMPDILRRTPGEMIVVLVNRDFVSFAIETHEEGKALVAIKDHRARPLSLPNVARNVIAHGIGHAIGLGHNADPAMLMCGRPAPCRPDLFMSSKDRYFPLTPRERELLLHLYPRDWKPKSPSP